MKFYEKLCEITAGSGDSSFMPKVDEGLTIFEYVPNPEDKEKAWMPWAVTEESIFSTNEPVAKESSKMITDLEALRLRRE